MTLRDIVGQPISHIKQETIAGFYTPIEERTGSLADATAQSDALIAELRAADSVLITTPCYNFGAPSALKAWVDQTFRMGETFIFTENDPKALLDIENTYVICAYGGEGYLEGGGFRMANFLEPYLKFTLEFLGIGTAGVKFISMEGLAGDADAVAKSKAGGQMQIDALLG